MRIDCELGSKMKMKQAFALMSVILAVSVAPTANAAAAGDRKVVMASVTKFVSEQVMDEDKAGKITEKSRLLEDLELDSDSVGSICLDVELAFSLEIPDPTESTFKTVGDIVTYVVSHPHKLPAAK